MRQPTFCLLAIALVLLNACGVQQGVQTAAPMSQEQALATLMQTPVDDSDPRMALLNRRKKPAVSAEAFQKLLEQLVASGQVRLPQTFRGATATPLDLSQVTSLVTLIQSGAGILGVARGLLKINNNDATGTSGGLSGLMQLIQAAMPVILVIAPQVRGHRSGDPHHHSDDLEHLEHVQETSVIGFLIKIKPGAAQAGSGFSFFQPIFLASSV